MAPLPMSTENEVARRAEYSNEFYLTGPAALPLGFIRCDDDITNIRSNDLMLKYGVMTKSVMVVTNAELCHDPRHRLSESTIKNVRSLLCAKTEPAPVHGGFALTSMGSQEDAAYFQRSSFWKGVLNYDDDHPTTSIQREPCSQRYVNLP